MIQYCCGVCRKIFNKVDIVIKNGKYTCKECYDKSRGNTKRSRTK